MISCPTCGAETQAVSGIDAMCRALPPTMAEIVRALAITPGVFRTAEELAADVFAGVPMEPEDCPEAIRSAVYRGRKRLKPFGWEIVSRKGARNGYALRVVR